VFTEDGTFLVEWGGKGRGAWTIRWSYWFRSQSPRPGLCCWWGNHRIQTFQI